MSKPAINQSPPDSPVYTDGQYFYTEICKQEYSVNNCKFSAGFVEGHPVDNFYIRLEKDEVEPTLILLRADEMAALAWVINGALWSNLQEKVEG